MNNGTHLKLPTGYMVRSAAGLPILKEGTIFLDVETTSGDPTQKSTNPWRFCSTAGICIKSPNSPAFYVPVKANGIYDKYSLERSAVIRWLKDIFSWNHTWVNHNIKYDAHVIYNDFGLDFPGDLVCTLTRTKLYDSERVYKGGYGLDVLSEQLLGEDIRDFENKLQPYLEHSKDYGDIDPVVLGTYGCQDVITNQKLHNFLVENLPADVWRVARTEVALTKELLKMERLGMRVAPIDITKTQILTLVQIMKLDQEIKDEVGRWVNTTSNADMYDVICNMYGLPVIAWTNEDDDEKESNPSFNSDALKEYLSLVNAPTKFIKLAIESREKKQFNNLFLESYKTKHVNGYLHPTFNQVVRTGRLSCGDPNMQQSNEAARNLIIPHKEGESILSVDYSQIEYRTIVHYINDRRAIAAFEKDPDTDFHDYVAKDIGVHRKPAKTLNFQNAFGAGVRKMEMALSAIPEIVNLVREQLELDPMYARIHDKDKYLQRKVKEYAQACYRRYHSNLPTLKTTSKDCERVCRARGYVRTMMGRRRHIPPEMARIAFNAVNQGTAADIMKEKIVELAPVLEGTGIKMICTVHDELVFSGPKEVMHDPRTARDIVAIMEERTVPLSVPLRCSYGISDENWGSAKGEEKIPPYSKSEYFKWLKG